MRRLAADGARDTSRLNPEPDTESGSSVRRPSGLRIWVEDRSDSPDIRACPNGRWGLGGKRPGEDSRSDTGEGGSNGVSGGGGDGEDDYDRPRVRGDCADGERPCPYVACQYHLLFDVHPRTGSIWVNLPGAKSIPIKAPDDVAEKRLEEALGRINEMPYTCALDFADEGVGTLQEVAEAFGFDRRQGREGIRLIENKAIRRARKLWTRELEKKSQQK